MKYACLHLIKVVLLARVNRLDCHHVSAHLLVVFVALAVRSVSVPVLVSLIDVAEVALRGALPLCRRRRRFARRVLRSLLLAQRVADELDFDLYAPVVVAVGRRLVPREDDGVRIELQGEGGRYFIFVHREFFVRKNWQYRKTTIELWHERVV